MLEERDANIQQSRAHTHARARTFTRMHARTHTGTCACAHALSPSLTKTHIGLVNVAQMREALKNIKLLLK